MSVFINSITAYKGLTGVIPEELRNKINPGTLGRISAEMSIPVYVYPTGQTLFSLHAFLKLNIPNVDWIKFATTAPADLNPKIYTSSKQLFKELTGKQRKTRAQIKERKKNKRTAQNRINKQSSLDNLSKALSSPTFCVFLDVEWFERNNKLITEIGYTVSSANQHVKTEHFIIKEHLSKRNGSFVPDNKDNFNFGESLVLPIKEAMERVGMVLAASTYIIGHSIGGDVHALSPMLGKARSEEVKKWFTSKTMIDTATISKVISDDPGKRISITNCLLHFGIDHENLHNAGNDAHYNWKIAESFAKLTQPT